MANLDVEMNLVAAVERLDNGAVVITPRLRCRIGSGKLVGPQDGSEGGPDGRGEGQHPAGGILGVTHGDGAVEDSDLDAVGRAALFGPPFSGARWRSG